MWTQRVSRQWRHVEQVSSVQSTAPQSSVPPLRSGTANLCPAPTSVRGPEKKAVASSTATEGALKPSAKLTSAKLPSAKPAAKPATNTAVKPSAASATHALHDSLAAAATDSGSGGKEGPLPELPSTAAIASELYGLRLNDEGAPPTSTSTHDGQQPQPQNRGGVVSPPPDASAHVSAADATAASNTLPGAESVAPLPASDQPDANATRPMRSAKDKPVVNHPVSSRPQKHSNPEVQPCCGHPTGKPSRRAWTSGPWHLCRGSG